MLSTNGQYYFTSDCHASWQTQSFYSNTKLLLKHKEQKALKFHFMKSNSFK